MFRFVDVASSRRFHCPTSRRPSSFNVVQRRSRHWTHVFEASDVKLPLKLLVYLVWTTKAFLIIQELSEAETIFLVELPGVVAAAAAAATAAACCC